MNFDPNPLFFEMVRIYSEHKTDSNKIIINNEGGSRSSKTWDTIHLIYTFCDHNRNLSIPLRIGMFRNTLKDSREKLFYDFKECFKIMDVYSQCQVFKENQSPEVFLFGNKIEFRGLDEDSEAVGYDIVFINEALEVDNKEKVDGLKMRCRKLMIKDWNPKYTAHWCFDEEGQPDVFFTRTTYKNNKHLQLSIIKEIEGYEPTADNIKSGTADEYRWSVYGLGVRAQKEGLVFPKVTWVKSMPFDLDLYSLGMDFGETAQTAFVKTGVKLNKDKKHDLYCKKLFYHPTDNADIVIDMIKSTGENSLIWADNNQPGWISDIRAANFEIMPTRKFPGSREYWIQTIKKFNINIVLDDDFKREQENFCYRVLNGVQLSETIKKFDHLWSATGYSCVGSFREILQR